MAIKNVELVHEWEQQESNKTKIQIKKDSRERKYGKKKVSMKKSSKVLATTQVYFPSG